MWRPAAAAAAAARASDARARESWRRENQQLPACLAKFDAVVLRARAAWCNNAWLLRLLRERDATHLQVTKSRAPAPPAPAAEGLGLRVPASAPFIGSKWEGFLNEPLGETAAQLPLRPAPVLRPARGEQPKEGTQRTLCALPGITYLQAVHPRPKAAKLLLAPPDVPRTLRGILLELIAAPSR